ncbi:uncharacterized protein EV422DRAFT_361616 [Fimicolochytrium jonesii]|uniref:uncharacterized protein n=1 Tax=Fimicolochytrium jonesii TaxID=1396493 RepID=UPI0022FE718A|nr:uncharacterized protein EV422DRAFT_361616 [Fimicolochytrium jonesii]KAI8823599.1 hypothetical protein EV422DRAFT_361616 [Fimicolochytrium jonesii]
MSVTPGTPPPYDVASVKTRHLTLSPCDLFFTPTRSNVGVIAKITLHNTHHSGNAVGYKIKTNAPARYSVKNVIGVLPQGGMCDVLVRSESTIQPDDRFLLQTIRLSEEEAKRLDSTKWRTLDRARMTDTFIDCKVSPTRPRGFSNCSFSSTSTTSAALALSSSPQQYRRLSSSTSTPPSSRPQSGSPSSLLSQSQQKQIQQPFSSAAAMRFTKVDLIMFSVLCLLLGVAMPYTKSLFQLIKFVSV